MEILAEAAAYLAPDQWFVGMRQVRAYRWILIEQRSVRLQVTARCRSDHRSEVEVRLHEISDTGEISTPILEGVMLLASERPSPQQASPLVLQDERASNWSAEQVYVDGMFHGPAFRAVMAVERTGTDGSVAQMQAPSLSGFFRSWQTPVFTAEPVLLDAAGQLIGLWTLENLEEGFVVFPYRLESLAFLGPPLEPGEPVTCQSRTQLLEGGRVLSDIELIDRLGDVRIRLTGWEDKRFHISRQLYRFILAPATTALSVPWTLAQLEWLKGEAGSPAYQYRRIGAWAQWNSHFEFWEKVVAYLVLTQRERRVWQQLSANQQRRRDWLLGRVAAKEAVAQLVKESYELAVAPADVEIDTDAYGRPYATGAWQSQIDQPISVSIAHCADASNAVCVAALAAFCPLDSPLGVGIDVERARQLSQDFTEIAFTSDEQVLLSQVLLSAEHNTEPQYWPLRIWCAKEAVGKALGFGLGSGPHSIVATHVEPARGVVYMRIAGTLAQRFPALTGKQLAAFTAIEDGVVIASLVENDSTQIEGNRV